MIAWHLKPIQMLPNILTMKMNLIDADLCIVHEPRFELIACRRRWRRRIFPEWCARMEFIFENFHDEQPSGRYPPTTPRVHIMNTATRVRFIIRLRVH